MGKSYDAEIIEVFETKKKSNAAFLRRQDEISDDEAFLIGVKD